MYVFSRLEDFSSVFLGLFEKKDAIVSYLPEENCCRGNWVLWSNEEKNVLLLFGDAEVLFSNWNNVLQFNMYICLRFCLYVCLCICVCTIFFLLVKSLVQQYRNYIKTQNQPIKKISIIRS